MSYPFQQKLLSPPLPAHKMYMYKYIYSNIDTGFKCMRLLQNQQCMRMVSQLRRLAINGDQKEERQEFLLVTDKPRIILHVDLDS